MNTKSFVSWAGAAALSSSAAQAQTVVYTDDFEDNNNTGWTYLDRSSGTATVTVIGGGPGSPSFVEQNGKLEQIVDNYSFPEGTGGPQLGGIALSGSGEIGGTYTISLTVDSSEEGNGFQDHSIVFGYVDEDNFFYVETLATGSASLYSIVEGLRTNVGSVGISFSHDPTTIDIIVDTVVGIVSINYGGAGVTPLATGQLIPPGRNGIGSNNDAYTLDDYTITSDSPLTPTPLAITSFIRNPETGEVSVTWNSELGTQYFLEKSTDLGTWNEVDDATGEAGTTTVADPQPGSSKVFYRVRREE